MYISEFPGHMRSTKLTSSARVLTLGLKAKSLLSENLAGTAHAPHARARRGVAFAFVYQFLHVTATRLSLSPQDTSKGPKLANKGQVYSL